MIVSIIIVNYNTFEITCQCIASVIKYTTGVSYEIIVVDNASPNDNPDLFVVRFPNVKLVKSAVNGGFAKGNNLGIQHSSGEIILLLNSDTYLTEDSITCAANYLDKGKNIGALTVRLTYPDGKLQHTARKFRSIKNELLDLIRPALYLCSYQFRSQLMLNQYFNGDYNTWADWVSGAFMMFRRDVLSKLPGGILDERFFMYGEDQLWCYQLMQAGFRNYYVADTTVIHINNASTEPQKLKNLAKKLLDSELEIIKERKGEGIYYAAFKFIYTFKEAVIANIKALVFVVFRRKMR
jgi:GT2 family glycosyltransferase